MRRTRLVRSRTQGAESNHKNLLLHEIEPPGHGIGRSGGGSTTKIHQGVDANGRPLAMIVIGGQRNDGAMLAQVLVQIHVPRLGPGRPRVRPDAVIADRAYATGVIGSALGRRGIKAVIPDNATRQLLASDAPAGADALPGSTRWPTRGAATSSSGTSPWPSNGAASLRGSTDSRSPTTPASRPAPSPPGRTYGETHPNYGLSALVN
ncbi:transposase [Actinomyces sp. B33]|uniref:transposase n=1 Tax=Actinomyces sp. B33 TaxID=2942131 RepID=UPI003FA42FB5